MAELLNRVLKLADFFPEFTAEQAAKIFPRSGLWYYPVNHHVIDQGDDGRDLFIIRLGSVSISKTFGDAGADVASLGPGTMFGETGLLREGKRTATIVVTEEAQIYRLVYADIQYLLSNNRELAEHLQQLARERT